MEDKREQSCTPKEWDTCRVEKMGCRGCYYDVPKHILTNKEQPLNQHVLLKPPAFNIEPAVLKKQYGSDELHISDDCDTHKCLHCGSGVPAYCEFCYQAAINRITCLEGLNKALELSNCPRNTVLEFMDALRNIIISGEKDELKLNKIMQTIIFYERELK